MQLNINHLHFICIQLEWLMGLILLRLTHVNGRAVCHLESESAHPPCIDFGVTLKKNNKKKNTLLLLIKTTNIQFIIDGQVL